MLIGVILIILASVFKQINIEETIVKVFYVMGFILEILGIIYVLKILKDNLSSKTKINIIR